MKAIPITKANALFQQWQALLLNRTKRTQLKSFLIQGVRPINAALQQKIDIEAVLFLGGNLSDWAKDIISRANSQKLYQLSPELMKQLGEKEEDTPELLLVAKVPTRTLAGLKMADLQSKFIVVLDRPQSPGNVGAIVRSADALGAAMVIIAGHAADIWDPKSIRASRGSLFALPVIHAESPAEILAWVEEQKNVFEILGLTEDGDKALWDCDLLTPTLAVIGNETWGLSRQWQDLCSQKVVVPMQGTASSLNAASSAAIVLYEYARQRDMKS